MSELNPDLDYNLIINRIKQIYDTMSDEEKAYLRVILDEIGTYGYSDTYNEVWLADYKEIPVDIDTFIESDLYLGKTNRNGAGVYPYWRQVMTDLFTSGNKYEEVILTGATRIGKTSTAITCVAYMLYRLMCLRDPQKYFGKKEISKFSVLFFNITKELAAGVAFREFNDTLKASPWFNMHGSFSNSERNFYYIPEGDKITIDFGSDASHGLGKQVFCAVMDECNFSKAGIKDVAKAKAHMQDVYNTISARIKGTFRKGGEVYGKLFAVSSKRSDSDFMELYVQRQLEAGAGEHMYISDKPQWEVLPPSQFQPQKFTIAVGDRFHKGFVVQDNQSDEKTLSDLAQQGYLLLHPPIDMKSDFLADFDIALRDLAGISVPGALSFITQETISKCIGTRRNPFTSDVLQIGTQDNFSIEEFYHTEFVDNMYKHLPMYIHLDLSLVTDKTGISGVVVSGTKDIEMDDGKKVTMPTFTHIFSVAIEAPRGDKISYSKIMKFIFWLRSQGYNIKCITRDQFQSEYLAQLLEEQHFTTDKISLDRTPDGYMALRSVFFEQRIDLLDCQLLQDELIHLQRDAITGKVDHPVGGCFTGDTKIRLVDGRSLTITELLREQEYKENWVYTINENTLRVEPKRIKRVFQTKLTKDLVKVTLDTGESIVCTPDHRFMLRDGSYELAENLFDGCSLMPLYTKVSDGGLVGYRLYYEPMEDAWHYEHRKFYGGTKLKKGYVVHHKNYNKLDNCPSNLELMSKSDHTKLHNNATRDYSKVSRTLKDWYVDIAGSDVEMSRNNACRQGTINALKQSGKYKDLEGKRLRRIAEIECTFGVVWDDLTDSEKNSYGNKYSRLLDPTIRKRTSKTLSLRHKEGLFKNAEEAISNRVWYTNGTDNLYIKSTDTVPDGFWRGRTISEATKEKMRQSYKTMSPEVKLQIQNRNRQDTANRIWITDGNEDRYINKDLPIPEGFHRGRCRLTKNHKVVSVERVVAPCRVYDLTIEDNPNFALDVGVFVHNSKDTADSLAGAVWKAITDNPGVSVPIKNTVGVISAVNGGRNRYSGGTNRYGKPSGKSSIFPTLR